MASSEDMKEGFLCPICMLDFGNGVQLQLHFDEKHSKVDEEDPAAFVVQNLKDFFTKTKEKIKKGEVVVAVDNGVLHDHRHHHHPVSGISFDQLEACREDNRLTAVDCNDAFRVERSKRADMLATDANKLVIRLEKLLAVKGKAHEQSVVPWIPEDVVKLCPGCAKSFNALTRRKHHCRLCGSVMCNDCSTFVDFDLTKRLKLNVVDDADEINVRSCTFCKETLVRRVARAELGSHRPQLVVQYEKLRRLMDQGLEMSREYQDTARKLNAGESAPERWLEEAKTLRLKLLKMAEAVDAASKQIQAVDPDASEMTTDTLRVRIRMAAVNFVKDALVGLPGLPNNQEELAQLQEERKRRVAKRIEEEKERVAVKVLSPPPPKAAVSSPATATAVKYGNDGFASSLSGANYVSSDDPIVQQMANLREFIGQARSAGRYDDAKLLEENLNDLQGEYQKQRRQLEENYESYKHLFARRANDGEELVESAHDDDEEEEEEEKRVVSEVGAAVDFDEYDISGKNPFF